MNTQTTPTPNEATHLSALLGQYMTMAYHARLRCDRAAAARLTRMAREVAEELEAVRGN